MSARLRKGGRWCSAPNCKNNSNTNKNISFFGFPKDEKRAKRWTINCRREDLSKKDASYLNKNCTICSDHFESIMFGNFQKNRLKPDAVPTLFDVANPPKTIALKKKTPRRMTGRNYETYEVAKKSRIETMVSTKIHEKRSRGPSRHS